MPRISIVVPVYNMEKRLKTCVDSLLKQDVDFEIILVDDGSKDSGPAICDEYVRQDERIRAIHKKNDGLSMARNSGLDIAQGEYVCFVDSDDWIDADMLKRMLAAADEYDVEVVAVGISSDYEDSGKHVLCELKEEHAFFGREGCRKAIYAMEHAEVFPFSTNKLYRRSLLEGNQIRFEKINGPVEDILFNLRVMDCVQSIALLKGAPYHYMQYGAPTLARRHYPHMYEITQRVNSLRRAMYQKFEMTSEAEKDCCAFSCFKQYFHCVKNLYNCKGRIDPLEKRNVWNYALHDPQGRDDIRRSKGQDFSAKLMSIAVSLRFVWLASGFMSCVMYARRIMGPLYKVFRNRVVVKSKN